MPPNWLCARRTPGRIEGTIRLLSECLLECALVGSVTMMERGRGQLSVFVYTSGRGQLPVNNL